MENPYYTQFHTSAELESIFSQVFGVRLGFCGFEAIAPRKWVQDTGRGFKYLFHLHPQHNGLAYLPCGAISLDFVPRLVRGKVKLQPKPKNVVVHYSFGQKTRWDWMIDKSRENLPQKLERIAAESVTEITAWFERFKSVGDIAAAIDRDKASIGEREFYCYPMLVLAYSFSLARVRRVSDARSEFERILKSNFFDPAVRPELREFFEAEIQKSVQT